MPTIVITGGTGMIGTRLTELLTGKGYEVIILSRQSSVVSRERKGVSYANWDVAAQTIDREAIAKADHIIHLAGAGVADKRWIDDPIKLAQDPGIDCFVELIGERGTIKVGWKGSFHKVSGATEWTKFGEGYDKVGSFKANIANFATPPMKDEPHIGLLRVLAKTSSVNKALLSQL